MDPRDLTRIRFVGDPQLSPDATRVAFVVTTLSEERDEYLANVWVVDVAGGEPRRFTTGPQRDTAPRWSPDGTRLAFLSERDGKKKPQLYVMPVTGGEPVRLTDLPNGAADPVWSPDGTRLALVSRVGGWQEPESDEAKRKSKPPRVITTLKHKWNGEGFVHDRPRHVFVVAADGGAPVPLTDGDAEDADPAWSPDGELIAFVSARHATRDEDDASDVWVVPAKGGEPRRVTDTGGPVAVPVFSPDGGAIAFTGRRGLHAVGRNVRVFVAPLSGGAPVCLTASLDRSVAGSIRVAWSADRRIVFPVEDRGDVALYRVRDSGTDAPAKVIAGERWVTGISASRDGARLAFTATDVVSPAELFITNGDGTGERQLTDLNHAWKAEVAPSRPERFRFQRAGSEVDAWVMKPFGFEPNRRYPTLLSVHGGPHTQYGHFFFDEFQVYAAAGYAVLFANPRGSQGYGEAFTRAVVGDWGGGDFDDVMAAVDEAIHRFDFIDPERLGVMGGSYGGFLTSWIVGHTGRFKAACSERAVNNQLTMVGTSDIGHWFQAAESDGRSPWDDVAWYLGRSPVTYAKHVTTPLLILHSEDDLRCPIEQAEQLFIALRTLGKEVRFVRFPDENHELSRSGKPRHRLERFRLILDWFDAHLKRERPAPAPEDPRS